MVIRDSTLSVFVLLTVNVSGHDSHRCQLSSLIRASPFVSKYTTQILQWPNSLAYIRWIDGALICEEFGKCILVVQSWNEWFCRAFHSPASVDGIAFQTVHSFSFGT